MSKLIDQQVGASFRTRLFSRSLSSVVASNVFSVAASSIVVLLVPRVVGVEQYAFFQLYIFYVSYVGFLQLGWSDGVYLRYGGHNYDELPFDVFRNQFRLLFLTQILVAALLGFLLYWYSDPGDFYIVAMAVAVSSLILNIRIFFLLTMQASYRMQAYSSAILIDRLVYLVASVVLVAMRVDNFGCYIAASIIGNVISLMVSCWICRDIVKPIPIAIRKIDIHEVCKNMASGIGLMLANVCSLLIVGAARFGIEKKWGTVEFGKISLILSLIMLFLVVINSVGIVIFPLLRRINQPQRAEIYSVVRGVLGAFLLLALIAQIPLDFLINSWLPEYRDAIRFLPFLLPVLIFEAKQALLSNTYFKTMRLERIMLAVNVVAALFSVVGTLISTWILNDVMIAVFVIPCALAFRSILSDIYFSIKLGVSVMPTCIELVLLTIFSGCVYFFPPVWGVVIYAAISTVYLFYRWPQISQVRELTKGSM